jgi:hypothetical protein
MATSEGYESIEVRLIAGRPLGAARTGDTKVGRGAAGIIRKLGGVQIAARYLVAGDVSAQEEICAALSAARRLSAHYDPAWLALSPTPDDGTIIIFALTRAQVEILDIWLPACGVVLNNGQTIKTVDTKGNQWWSRQNTYELSTWHIPVPRNGTVDPSAVQLQAIPSAPFAYKLGSPNAYFCVVNPCHQPALGRGFAIVINPYLEQDYRGIAARFPVLIRFSDKVPLDRVSIDETVAVAIGLRAGEPLLVQRGPRRHQSSRRILSFRHAVCRAVPAATLDMEKPVVRLSNAVFDVLGVSSGSRIVIEGLGEVAQRRLSRVVVRGLEERSERLALGGTPDILDIVGSVDLPAIAMDLATRERLGVSRGTAVYVRPALGSILADEFTSLSFVLLAATVGSIVSNHVIITVVLITIYSVLTLMYIGRKLR